MKTTLITGASGGIGEAFARRLATDKHNLFLIARSEEKLARLSEELKTKYGIEAQFLALDLTRHDADTILFNEAEKRGLQIDWLINNAGFGAFGDFAAHELEREIGMVDLNIRTLVALSHRFLKPMRERKSGVIINVSSTAGFQPVPFMATYSATKAFVTSFSEALWEENRPFGVLVMALCPGATETNFFNAAGAKERPPGRTIETPKAVVETALQGVKSGRSHIVSGWTNYLVANAGNVVPNWLIARTIGGVLRSRAEQSK